MPKFGVVKPTALPREESRKGGKVSYPRGGLGNLGVLLAQAGVKGRPVKG